MTDLCGGAPSLTIYIVVCARSTVVSLTLLIISSLSLVIILSTLIIITPLASSSLLLFASMFPMSLVLFLHVVIDSAFALH
ncbi:hypothetical protein BDY19DRAFT_998842 [Irpex rosettiformis]|uniref:Uncharacterized protein n=1 Tax=Irpex rosettiformis TaxID=378272 RepID=A0ACB8TM83_9APHY|nr:hypothetical protein BDY19DRAFT_998842 [Irpex rosettiformis]